MIENLVHTYNIQETYLDYVDQWMGILAEATFAVRITYHWTKQKSPGQFVFGGDTILPINIIADRRYIRQRKQA